MAEELSAEERLQAALDEDEDDDDEEDFPTPSSRARHDKIRRQNQSVIDKFIGAGNRTYVTAIVQHYYCELITWALHQYLERQDWRIVDTLSNKLNDPMFTDVDTGKEKINLLMDGHLLIEKGESRYIVTVEFLRWRGSIQVEGPPDKKQDMKNHIESIMKLAEEENFYRGKKLEYNGNIRFLDLKNKSWEDIILEPETKSEIKANTIDFLNKREQWGQYGIPAKRGVLLAGEPGTGKTIVCKALMVEADGITCITTNAYALDSSAYLTDLYELAEDLSPCIVFIEDIDLIGQNREEFGYQRGNALLSLLNVLDGIEENNGIITVATTNCLDTLDKALRQRPSRFDCVIKLSRPTKEQRKELISRLCQKIPLDEQTQDFIAAKTENLTPAQLQEVVFSLVIQYSDGQNRLNFSQSEIERAVSRINDKSRCQIGFVAGNNHGNGRLNGAMNLSEG